MPVQVNTTISALSERIMIKKAISSETVKGKPVKSSFETYKNTFANVYVQSGAMQSTSQYSTISSTVYFTIRYDSNVDYNCQILWKNKIYKIDFIDETINGFQRISTSLA
jgi:SPP1 family predicted phage head-tail adaptor